MNNIDVFKDIRNEFGKLIYNDSATLDRLSRRLRMIINHSFENSDYIEDFNDIYFSPIAIYSGMKDASFVEAWLSGKSKTINLIDTIIEELTLFKNVKNHSNANVNSHIDRSKVFIVHGHDDGAKNEVARFIEKLGFEAKILHEQVDSGATIIEKLEKHTDVGFAIVLYTACDIGGVRSKPEDLKPRARQNVVFEHGLLIGKIGRANVVALVKGDLEIPNDISGVVYKSMDISGAWKYSIAKEMKSSGYDVDMNKVD